MDEPYLSKNPRNKEVLDRTVGDRNDVDAGSCTKQQQQLQFPVIKGTYITPSILRLTTNALLLVLVIIVRQVNFVTAPRVGTITGMDICTGLMAAIIVLCFLLSLQMCYDQWLRRVSSEVVSPSLIESKPNNDIANGISLHVRNVLVFWKLITLTNNMSANQCIMRFCCGTW
jgi:hypothetical protein